MKVDNGSVDAMRQSVRDRLFMYSTVVDVVSMTVGSLSSMNLPPAGSR